MLGPFEVPTAIPTINLLLLSLSLKLKTVIKPQRSVKRFNVRKLQDPYVLQKYTSTLSNKFSMLRDELSIDKSMGKDRRVPEISGTRSCGI